MTVGEGFASFPAKFPARQFARGASGGPTRTLVYRCACVEGAVLEGMVFSLRTQAQSNLLRSFSE